MKKLQLLIQDKTFDSERALYHLTDATVRNCRFEGPADGESALKECRSVALDGIFMDLRYPLWHAKDFSLVNCVQTEMCRAAIWYSENFSITRSQLNGIKVLRECKNVDLHDVIAVSPEIGWKCERVSASNCSITSEYAFFECKHVRMNHLDFTGKYSFQYTKDVLIRNSRLKTKDAFWHANGVRVENSTLEGEYLGWYSKNLTLVNCHIRGTQPFCYCENLRLINCTMEDCDLSFEYSTVNATVNGKITSVKNPKRGKIVADEIGEIILQQSVYSSNAKIITRNTH